MLEATRISDGKDVVLKKVVNEFHPQEGLFGRLFSSQAHASHPSNHCVPVYDVFEVPGSHDKRISLVVMPLLQSWNSPVFETVGEAVEFFRQLLQVSSPAHSKFSLIDVCVS